MTTLAGPLWIEPEKDVARRSGALSIPVITTAIMLIGSSVLLFARLGTYSLWTDEASTAITAAGVWRTGDTSAWLNDHNLLTYRDGLLLKNHKDRYTSPLQFFVAAPFIGLLGPTAFACRLPFALCGLGTVLLIVRWLQRVQPPPTVWIAAAILLLCGESFFLFQRQCRYFALATFLSTLVASLYCRWDGSRKRLALTGIALSLLLTAQYLDYAAVVGCLLVDYGIWGRRHRPIRGINWLVLILPQVVTAAAVCRIWNPIERAAGAMQGAGPTALQSVTTTAPHAWLHGLFTLFWWNLRDLVRCDFAVWPLLVACPILYFRTRNHWLVRGPTALLVFVGAISLFTAHPAPAGGDAEVRYLAPLLPLCIGIGITAAGAIRSLRLPAKIIVFTVSAVALARFSTLAWCGELLHPQTEPYTPVAAWIDRHVPAGATIYIAPDFCVSPVMWDAPGPTYVWQLSDPPRPDYAGLSPIYFKGRVPPDFMIAFGPSVDETRDWQTRMAARGVRYEPVATVPVYYKEMFRPELIWRSFKTVPPGPGEQVLIFRRVEQPRR